MTNIILCGGSGTRLWPMSRTLMPKQFIKIFNQKSLFQHTIQRNSKFCNNNLIVSNLEQYFLASDQIEELNQNYNCNYLLEPIGRNTAPAITLACLTLEKDEIVLVTPSDHLIKNQHEYEKVLNQAKQLAEDDFLVTFGIKPTSIETGYGYIETDLSNNNYFDVKAFKEKPNYELASQYFEDNVKLENSSLPLKWYWNAGIFCFKASIFLEEIKKYSPEIYQKSKEALKLSKISPISNKDIRITHDSMCSIPEDSIDYAVMEKSSLIKVIPSNIEWNDVGSFDSLDRELAKDKYNNTKDLNHIAIDSKNNFIKSEKRKIATIGIDDCIIVDTKDALLISKKGDSQRVKEVVSILEKYNPELINTHLTGYRPWGTYEVLDNCIGYKIKKIIVQPNARLSLQKHFYRNEHWVVVSGTATVTIEDKTFLLKENESTYIKAKEVHRLENKGKQALVIIEVQVGEYTEEDDIIRIEDDFKRD